MMIIGFIVGTILGCLTMGIVSSGAYTRGYEDGRTVDVAYLCDGKVCEEKKCAKNSDCNHTKDISRAINFEKLSDGNYIEKMGDI